MLVKNRLARKALLGKIYADMKKDIERLNEYIEELEFRLDDKIDELEMTIGALMSSVNDLRGREF